MIFEILFAVMADILGVAVEIMMPLKNIVRQSFGPDGIDVAMKTYSGSILVTNSGHEIFSSLSLSHPIGRIICQQIKQHLGLTGDGSKQMIFILAEFLNSIHGSVASSNRRQITEMLSGFSRACGYVISTTLPNIRDYFIEICHEQNITEDNREALKQCVKSILKTAVTGKFTKEISEVLFETITELIFSISNLEEGGFLRHLNKLIDEFKDICIRVSGINVTNTKIINGFLIKRNSLRPLDRTKLWKNAKFIIIKCDFNVTGIQFGETTKFNLNQSKLDVFLSSRVHIFQKIAEILEQNEISVVLCNHGIPEYGKSFFRGNFHIAQHVNENDIERISNYFAILPVENLDEIFENNLSNFIGVASEVNEIIIGNECYLKLFTEEKFTIDNPSCQLVLCSPHPYIGDQYYSAMLNMLKIVKMACYQQYGINMMDEFALTFIPSAGCPEINIANYLAEVAKYEPDSMLQTVLLSLTNAIMEIPRCIHENAKQTNSKFVDVMNTLQQSKNNCDRCIHFGIDSENGAIFEPYKHNVIEPLSSKILLLSHVLQTAQQIIKIDDILPAKRKSERSDEL